MSSEAFRGLRESNASLEAAKRRLDAARDRRSITRIVGVRPAALWAGLSSVAMIVGALGPWTGTESGLAHGGGWWVVHLACIALAALALDTWSSRWRARPLLVFGVGASAALWALVTPSIENFMCGGWLGSCETFRWGLDVVLAAALSLALAGLALARR